MTRRSIVLGTATSPDILGSVKPCCMDSSSTVACQMPAKSFPEYRNLAFLYTACQPLLSPKVCVAVLPWR